MFRFVEHFPESDQPYIGDSYGNQTFICFDEDKPCSSHCDCRQLGSQPDDFAFIATKASTALSITFYDSALGEVVAAVSGEAGTQNTEAWGGTTFDGLAILAQYARLKQHLELLDPGLAIVPTLRLLVDGFLADGQVFKSFGYNDLFERGYLSLELWNDFQHRQLDDDITLLDDTFSAVAELEICRFTPTLSLISTHKREKALVLPCRA
ncbi:hypothetical protein NEMBOFW57_005686 [Staphylotrichum longicolle]|uniref:Uncharacterized protein n=1 Tax=Staphylotrichum longicolle TaxID=669026 RepID=A0AAD4EXG8_9PEZI|nr:hypothetical protein NEMBOFW57_005686 [Staphylotrichum longicolle]